MNIKTHQNVYFLKSGSWWKWWKTSKNVYVKPALFL